MVRVIVMGYVLQISVGSWACTLNITKERDDYHRPLLNVDSLFSMHRGRNKLGHGMALRAPSGWVLVPAGHCTGTFLWSSGFVGALCPRCVGMPETVSDFAHPSFLCKDSQPRLHWHTPTNTEFGRWAWKYILHNPILLIEMATVLSFILGKQIYSFCREESLWESFANQICWHLQKQDLDCCSYKNKLAQKKYSQILLCLEKRNSIKRSMSMGIHCTLWSILTVSCSCCYGWWWGRWNRVECVGRRSSRGFIDCINVRCGRRGTSRGKDEARVWYLCFHIEV